MKYLIVLLLLTSQHCFSGIAQVAGAPKKNVIAKDSILNAEDLADSQEADDTLTKFANPIKYRIAGATVVTSNGTVPFWMRANQNGAVPLSGFRQHLMPK
jgi:hypothetical protein